MREIACGEKEKYKKEQGHIMEETENKNTHSFLPDNFEKRRRFVTFSDDTCLSVRQFSLAACGKPWNSPPPLLSLPQQKLVRLRRTQLQEMKYS